MAELTDRRFAVGSARAERELALRNLHSAESHADFWREADGSFQVVDQGLNPEIYAEIQTLQPALDAGAAALQAATARYDEAARAYDSLAAESPLFASDNSDPILLLPLRLEAVYRDNAGSPELRIRVYPDDVHVDSHELALTEGERRAGTAYWREIFAAGMDVPRRQAAWRALVAASGGERASWVRAALTPSGQPPGEPGFPDVELRPEAWMRSARTLLLPDRLEFSAYRDGALVWREVGADIPDTLPVGLAPKATGGGAGPDSLPFDDTSRWLIDFPKAVECGMGLAVPLEDPEQSFDLLTVVGVSSQDSATGAARVQDMLAAHTFSGGLSPLPARTPTNNTPETRSGWLSRGAPNDPDLVERWRAAYDASSPQEAARLARALGVDGAAVLAGVCDPGSDDEALLHRLHSLQADFYSWSRMWRPRESADTGNSTPCRDPWFLAARDHYSKYVRARGPLPVLRIARQPYGLLPVSSTDLWRGEDVDPNITFYVGSFLAVMAEHLDRGLQVGEGADQDAVLLDLLSREASPRQLNGYPNFAGTWEGKKPPPAAVGAIPSTSPLAWRHAEQGGAQVLDPFPDGLPQALAPAVSGHPLAQLLFLFDEGLAHMRQTHTPPAPDPFDDTYRSLTEPLWQLRNPPTTSMFYAQAEWTYNFLRNLVSLGGPALPDAVAERAATGAPVRELFAHFVTVEDDAIADLPRLERLYRETLEALSSRVDAWVSSLAASRLDGLRKARPSGIRTGGYGWLTNIESINPNPQRQGYLLTPSLHHATTAAVLRSGWQAHSDKGAFAVDIQSARVRRAQAMIEGVRGGQTVNALLGYQFERALHDAKLDACVAGFRQAYPLAPLVEAEAPGHEEAKVSIGARNVVDGQALRRDRARFDSDDTLRSITGADPQADGPAIRRMLAELEETFDAVSDLLLAESVHQLVGGSALRAGLAADAIGRGQDLPSDYDVLRTPRGGIAVTHHVGMLLPAAMPPGWNDDRPLAQLEPGVEGWLRRRFGAAADAPLSARLGALGWCALDLLIAPATSVRDALTAAGDFDEAAFTDLMLLCERLRAVTSGATPLTPAHLDPADPEPGSGHHLTDLGDRVGGWLAKVRAAAKDLGRIDSAEAAEPVVRRLAELGLPVGAGPAAADLDRLRSLLGSVDLADRAAPPDPNAQPAAAGAWVASLLAVTAALLHPAVKVAPRLTRGLPPAPAPAPDADAVAGWLRDMCLVRPRVDTLDGAMVAAEVLAQTSAASYVLAQPVAAEAAAQPWVATAALAEGAGPRNSLVLQQDDPADTHAGLVVDSWTEVVPRPPGAHGAEEIVGVAFDYDRPGARPPQAMLIAVPPDPARGWCLEDVHACVEETLLLSRIRTLDLVDVPELRTVLPIPDGQG
ncbi:MAG TPA: hypothetical protein VF557_18370 [Jatrophihabitans sp.]|jgi:hypothetical protein|uniref:hypothetical protein n=1 Tax=Jatrophihabitans sp. TaxID=1932789 RepID=UPI002F191AAF